MRWRCSFRLNRKACGRACSPRGARYKQKNTGLLQNKNAIATCTKKSCKNRNPETFLSRFGPEKVPGFVHIFFRELFCNSPLLYLYCFQLLDAPFSPSVTLTVCIWPSRATVMASVSPAEWFCIRVPRSSLAAISEPSTLTMRSPAFRPA